jgi:hypothetical protein
MEQTFAPPCADIQVLTDRETEIVSGAFHNEIRLPNLGMVIFGRDDAYGVVVKSGNKTVTIIHNA